MIKNDNRATFERIRNIIEERNISYGELSKLTDIPKSALHRYATGDTAKIPWERIEKIADALHVSAAFLMGREDETASKSEKNDTGTSSDSQTNQKPRIGRIKNAHNIMSSENYEGFDEVPDSFPCDFTVKCSDDSMTGARIFKDDIVYLKLQSSVQNGQIAAVLINNKDIVLRRLFFSSDSIILQAENPSHEPAFFSSNQRASIKIIGLATGFTSVIK